MHQVLFLAEAELEFPHPLTGLQHSGRGVVQVAGGLALVVLEPPLLPGEVEQEQELILQEAVALAILAAAAGEAATTLPLLRLAREVQAAPASSSSATQAHSAAQAAR